MEIPDQPAFGEADLTNCERELIHLPGSIQPHGALLVLDADGERIVQVSANARDALGRDAESLLGRPITDLGADLARAVNGLLADTDGAHGPLPFRIRPDGVEHALEVLAHRGPDRCLFVELEPIDEAAIAVHSREITHALAETVTRIGSAHSMTDLAERTVAAWRTISGYDRVMFYHFDPDGHGEVMAEAKREDLEPYLGLHYPASDIPRRARDLYVRNRVRALVDVHYEPVPLLPRMNPDTGGELDMSMSWLRSMSPLHLQYLRNMGVTATLVASLVRNDQLWGLIACHHYSPKRVPYVLRAACEMVAELVAARIAVLDNFAHVRSESLVRRLETRMIDATSRTGDWRHALIEHPAVLLELTNATGVAVSVEGEILTAGTVPSTADLEALTAWVGRQPLDGGLFRSDRLVRERPDLAHLAESACGILAVQIDATAGEYVLWLRGERVREVRWAGDPRKPVIAGDDPLELSPRRSFAVWTEQVRGTSRPWSPEEIATARAAGVAMRDVATQFRAMSVLLTEDRLRRMRLALQRADEGLVIADAAGRILLVNESFSKLFQRPHAHLGTLAELALLIRPPESARAILRSLMKEHRSWRGVLTLAIGDETELPIAVRGDAILRPGGGVLGYIVVINSIAARRRASASRERLHQAILEAQRPLALGGLGADAASDFGDLVRAVLSTASVAVMEIANDGAAPAAAPLLDDLEASTRRVADLARQVITYSTRGYGA